VRRLDVRQARVRILAQHPIEPFAAEFAGDEENREEPWLMETEEFDFE